MYCSKRITEWAFTHWKILLVTEIVILKQERQPVERTRGGGGLLLVSNDCKIHQEQKSQWMKPEHHKAVQLRSILTKQSSEYLPRAIRFPLLPAVHVLDGWFSVRLLKSVDNINQLLSEGLQVKYCSKYWSIYKLKLLSIFVLVLSRT